MPSRNKRRSHIRPIRSRSLTRRKSLVSAPISSANRAAQNSFAALETPSVIFAQNPQTEPSIFDTESTTHNVLIPTPVQAGDALVVIMPLRERASDGQNGLINTLPANWIRLRADVVMTHYTLFFFGKIAVGNEQATLVNFVTDIPVRGVAHAMRWTNWRNSGVMTNDIEISVDSGANNGPNPPLHDPVNAVVENIVWVAGFAFPGLESITSIPANYTNHLRTAATTIGIQLNTTRRELAASSEDPGLFITSGGNFWAAFTMSVRSAPEANPRSAGVPHSEFQVPPAPNRQSRVYVAEVQVDDVERLVKVFHAEMETPSNDRYSRVPWAEAQFPDVEKAVQIPHAELELPDVIVSPTEKFTLLVELEIAMEISLVNQTSIPWTQSGNAWLYNLGNRNVIDEDRKQITSVTVGEGKALTAANNVSDCQATDATWFNLVSANELYVNPSGAVNPNTRITLARFKVFFSNYAVHYQGQFYEPRVQFDSSDLNLRIAANDETLQGSPTIEGQIKLANGDGFIDSLLANYVVIGGRIDLKTLSGGAATPLSSNIVGEIVRTDSIVALRLWN